MPQLETTLLREQHVKYWLRCSKTFLPEAYTGNDSSRVTLAFFVVAALDLLDLLDSKIESVEREGWINWVYSCQLTSGGFRGFTGTKFGDDIRNRHNEHWDPASVPATFFALATLLILGDDLSRVRRKECLLWLRKVQRGNGSFGETLGEDERIEGSSDLRFCCCAAGIRYILRGRRHGSGDNGDGESEEGQGNHHKQPEPNSHDINTDLLIRYIERCQVGLEPGPISAYVNILHSNYRHTTEAFRKVRGRSHIVRHQTGAGQQLANKLCY